MDYLDLTPNSYSQSAYASDTKELLTNAEMQLLGQGIEFDSMVGIGNSGLLVLPLLARHFKVPFFAMRKAGQLSHNSKQPDGDGMIGHNWILVDDVKILGGTISYVVKTINKLARQNSFFTVYRGAYLYEPLSMSPGEFVHPGGTQKSVMKVTDLDGKQIYVAYGEYAKVREIAKTSSNLVETVQTVMTRFPTWNESHVIAIASTI